MKRIIFLLLLPSICSAGTFTKVGEKSYAFTGPMVPSDFQSFKDIADQEVSFEIAIDSEGGDLFTGIKLAEFTKSISNRVKVTVGECYSAAAIWASADPGMKFRDDKSFLAYHLAWYSSGGTPAEQTIGMTTMAAYWLGTCMNKTLGEKRSEYLMKRMSDARDKHGIDGFIVQTKDGRERTGLWTWDKGWVWDDGSPALTTFKTPVHAPH